MSIQEKEDALTPFFENLFPEYNCITVNYIDVESDPGFMVVGHNIPEYAHQYPELPLIDVVPLDFIPA